MNHRWNENNVCVNCGLHRMMREYRKVVRTYSALGRDGCWYDKPVYQYGKAWYYGIENKEMKDLIRGIGFQRPECSKNSLH